MQSAPEGFSIRPGETHTSAGGIVFALDDLGHKHGANGGATGRYLLRYELGGLRGETALEPSGQEGWYAEGYAAGVLFRLAGSQPGGSLAVVLDPQTARTPRTEAEVIPETVCREVLASLALFSAGLPAGASLSNGASVSKGPGTCIFSPIDSPRTVIVVGVYSLEVLYVRVGPREEPPALR